MAEKLTIEEMQAWAKEAYNPRLQIKVDISAVKPKIKAAVETMAKRGYIFEKSSLQAVGAYCSGYAILLSGSVGVGKTLFFRCLNPDILILNMGDIIRMNYDALINLLGGYRDREVLLDDLGCGEAYAKDFGAAYDALLTFLNDRAKSTFRTHFTTNLDSKALIEKYDYRAIDRIYGMAKPYVLERAESYRKAGVL